MTLLLAATSGLTIYCIYKDSSAPATIDHRLSVSLLLAESVSHFGWQQHFFLEKIGILLVQAMLKLYKYNLSIAC